MIQALYEAYKSELPNYSKIWEYYKGNTDAKTGYIQTDRSNKVVTANYVKKFVKEETSYSVGNPMSFSSKSNNEKAIEIITMIRENFNENHDINVFSYMTLFGLAYEVYYLDKEGDFQVKHIRPTHAFHLEEEDGRVSQFIHVWHRKELVGNEVETVEYIDLYDNKEIITYRHKDGSFIEVKRLVHYFGECPVGVAKLSELLHEDTIYNDIKSLQDALESTFSDVVNEISDFRNAYLVLTGLSIDEEEAKVMKQEGIIQNPSAEGKVEWLIKNVNDTFIQNTLKALQEKIYEVSSHINTNDSEQMSNASGIALKSRLINLMQRCKVNENSFSELIKTRIRIMFNYASIKNMGAFDWKDISFRYSPLIPSDDNATADMITKLKGTVSDRTLLTLLSFVENADEEVERAKEELLDNGTMDNYIQEDNTEEEGV